MSSGGPRSDRRPSVFIGSSTEGHAVAEAIQVNLDRFCEVVIWSQGVFGLSGGTLETLVETADEFDFAVLVVRADDMVSSRERTQPAPRDNVLFELGLFVGVLGRKRTFVVYDRAADAKLPSDLAGVTIASYQLHSSGNLQASLGAACTQIKAAISELDLRERYPANLVIDQSTFFQSVAGTLPIAAHQFFILMGEQGVSLNREGRFGSGLRHVYNMANRSAGHGYFSVDSFCTMLADSGMLQQDLRNRVTLTERGHLFARWLVEQKFRAVHFESEAGGWGQVPDQGLHMPSA